MMVRFLVDYRGVLTNERFYRAGELLEIDEERGRALVSGGRAEEANEMRNYPVACSDCGRRLGVSPKRGQQRACADPICAGRSTSSAKAQQPVEDKAVRPAENKDDLTQVPGVGKATAKALHEAGLITLAAVVAASDADLQAAVGARSAAIRAAAEELLNE